MNVCLFFIGGAGLFMSRHSTLQGAYVGGQILVDADADCSTPDAQVPLKNWVVEANNGTDWYYTNSDSLGNYLFSWIPVPMCWPLLLQILSGGIFATTRKPLHWTLWVLQIPSTFRQSTC
ncbi:MAG: hypothetical protein H6574_17475 [Lewinellaceae bacterium]|nr:hypothetical protein [Lewinellaceae bacterium]